jgi:predicted RNase H-like HicB family nuclease
MATTSFQLTAVFRPVEDGWVQASIQELPGVITAAPTEGEAKAMLADALHEYLLALGELEGRPDSDDGGSDHSPLAVTVDV